jgi:tetratricopeptide (TPR) repeat protein
MLRLLSFFLVVLVLSSVVQHLPIIGPIFRGLHFIGFWLIAIGLAWALTRLGEKAILRKRDAPEIRRLQAVDTPHNRGKLGSLLLGQGQARKSLPHFEAAVAGEPEVAEWAYRLGCAHLNVGQPEEAVEALQRVCELDEEYAYGAAQMRLAVALSKTGRYEEALEVLKEQQRNHGPSPENAYRRGMAYKRLGHRTEARLCFDEVGSLAHEAARYKKREAGNWAVRARLASMF